MRHMAIPASALTRWPVAHADNDQMTKMALKGIDGIYFADKARSQGLQGRRARQEISRKRGDRVVPRTTDARNLLK